MPSKYARSIKLTVLRLSYLPVPSSWRFAFEYTTNPSSAIMPIKKMMPERLGNDRLPIVMRTIQPIRKAHP